MIILKYYSSVLLAQLGHIFSYRPSLTGRKRFLLAMQFQIIGGLWPKGEADA